jgi:hypothetical protein
MLFDLFNEPHDPLPDDPHLPQGRDHGLASPGRERWSTRSAKFSPKP